MLIAIPEYQVHSISFNTLLLRTMKSYASKMLQIVAFDSRMESSDEQGRLLKRYKLISRGSLVVRRKESSSTNSLTVIQESVRVVHMSFVYPKVHSKCAGAMLSGGSKVPPS